MGSDNHQTQIPEQLQTTDLPDDPLEEWGNATLKATFADIYADHVVGGRGGWMATVALRAMQDELLDRGISPVRALETEASPMPDADMGTSSAAAD